MSPFSRTGTDRERGHGSKKGGVESRGKEGDRVIVEDKDSSLVKSTDNDYLDLYRCKGGKRDRECISKEL